MTTRLPVATKFCAVVVDVGYGHRFFIDGNSKITRSNGTYAAPAPNAFSLPAASAGAGYSCPGSTAVCRSSCYVRGLAAHAPDLYARYESNAGHLSAVLDNQRWATRAAVRLATWIANNAVGGFRWHVSGDVWNGRHASLIVDVCKLTPQVPHWIYTRTLGAVEVLRRAANLAVNVSADRDNYAEARAVAVATGARVCYLSSDGEVPADLPPGSVIFPDYKLRGRELTDPTAAPWWGTLTHEQRTQVCPPDFFGQSEQHRCGPCGKCLT